MSYRNIETYRPFFRIDYNLEATLRVCHHRYKCLLDDNGLAHSRTRKSSSSSADESQRLKRGRRQSSKLRSTGDMKKIECQLEFYAELAAAIDVSFLTSNNTFVEQNSIICLELLSTNNFSMVYHPNRLLGFSHSMPNVLPLSVINAMLLHTSVYVCSTLQQSYWSSSNKPIKHMKDALKTVTTISQLHESSPELKFLSQGVFIQISDKLETYKQHYIPNQPDFGQTESSSSSSLTRSHEAEDAICEKCDTCFTFFQSQDDLSPRDISPSFPDIVLDENNALVNEKVDDPNQDAPDIPPLPAVVNKDTIELHTIPMPISEILYRCDINDDQTSFPESTPDDLLSFDEYLWGDTINQDLRSRKDHKAPSQPLQHETSEDSTGLPHDSASSPTHLPSNTHQNRTTTTIRGLKDGHRADDQHESTVDPDQENTVLSNAQQNEECKSDESVAACEDPPPTNSPAFTTRNHQLSNRSSLRKETLWKENNQDKSRTCETTGSPRFVIDESNGTSCLIPTTTRSPSSPFLPSKLHHSALARSTIEIHGRAGEATQALPTPRSFLNDNGPRSLSMESLQQIMQRRREHNEKYAVIAFGSRDPRCLEAKQRTDHLESC